MNCLQYFIQLNLFKTCAFNIRVDFEKRTWMKPTLLDPSKEFPPICYIIVLPTFVKTWNYLLVVSLYSALHFSNLTLLAWSDERCATLVVLRFLFVSKPSSIRPEVSFKGIKTIILLWRYRQFFTSCWMKSVVQLTRPATLNQWSLKTLWTSCGMFFTEN